MNRLLWPDQGSGVIRGIIGGRVRVLNGLCPDGAGEPQKVIEQDREVCTVVCTVSVAGVG